MKTTCFIFISALVFGMGTMTLPAQTAKPSQDAKTQDGRPQDPNAKSGEPATTAAEGAKTYSGMYTFLKEGEFVQVTVEDEGRVTGFVSRFGVGESDKGSFLDQFFKSGKLEGNKLTFTTEVLRGVSFDFKGTVERGEGKDPGDEAYFVLKGTLTESTGDANKKVTSQTQEVAFELFPQEAGASHGERK